jgi:hypothetical protein
MPVAAGQIIHLMLLAGVAAQAVLGYHRLHLDPQVVMAELV